MGIEIQPESLAYCPFYCEENIWRLAQRPEIDGYDSRVVFISNPERCVCFNAQRACRDDAFVCWDYHVILIVRDECWIALDPDSLLPFGCTLDEYMKITFPFGDGIVEAPMFRVLGAAEYVRSFSSDRRHMRGPDGDFREQPPEWPVIQAEKSTTFNLWDFVDVGRNGIGVVLDMGEFEQRYL